MSELRGFDYGARFGHLLVYALFFGLLSVFSAVAALMDGEAMTRFGFVVSEREATAFFGIWSVLCAAGSAWIVARAEPGSVWKNTLTLGPDRIELNRSKPSPQAVSVPYDDIESIRHARNRKLEHLRIDFKSGALSLNRLRFEERATFLAFKTALEQRITLP